MDIADASPKKIVTILVSGFEPFGGSSLNPSQLLVEELSREDIPGAELFSIVLPVEFARAAEILLSKVAEVKPDLVLAFGQAEGRASITPEKIAINFDDARIPDNAGNQRHQQIIDPAGADGYFSTLPVETMVDAMNKNGVPSAISLSAGTFVCNHIFYSMQRALLDTPIKSGFIHLPLVLEQTNEFPSQPTLELALMVRAIRAAINKIIT